MLDILIPVSNQIEVIIENMLRDLEFYTLRSISKALSGRRFEASLREPKTGQWFTLKYTRYKGLPQAEFSLTSDQLQLTIKVSKDSLIESLLFKLFEELGDMKISPNI